MVLFKSEAILILNSFIDSKLPTLDWFNQVQPFVKAMLLYGSVAKGSNREDSDIDLVIILPLEIEERCTEGEYVYSFDNQEINIVLRSIERLRLLVKENSDEFQKEVFRNAEILYQSDDEVATLLTKFIS